MDVEKLIERLYKHHTDWGEGRTQDFFEVCLDCKDAATALSTLQAENEKLRETVDKYATAARVIALHLKPFCDESLPYDEMIADAARKASDELEQVKQERDAAIKELDEVTSEVDDLADFVDREIHPVIDYNLYLDLRENVDAVSMFQHEDEWRGLHKEE